MAMTRKQLTAFGKSQNNRREDALVTARIAAMVRPVHPRTTATRGELAPVPAGSPNAGIAYRSISQALAAKAAQRSRKR